MKKEKIEEKEITVKLPSGETKVIGGVMTRIKFQKRGVKVNQNVVYISPDGDTNHSSLFAFNNTSTNKLKSYIVHPTANASLRFIFYLILSDKDNLELNAFVKAITDDYQEHLTMLNAEDSPEDVEA